MSRRHRCQCPDPRSRPPRRPRTRPTIRRGTDRPARDCASVLDRCGPRSGIRHLEVSRSRRSGSAPWARNRMVAGLVYPPRPLTAIGIPSSGPSCGFSGCAGLCTVRTSTNARSHRSMSRRRARAAARAASPRELSGPATRTGELRVTAVTLLQVGSSFAYGPNSNPAGSRHPETRAGIRTSPSSARG